MREGEYRAARPYAQGVAICHHAAIASGVGRPCNTDWTVGGYQRVPPPWFPDTGPAIVIAASKRDRDLYRVADDGEEASPEIKAFFARMMRPPGT